LYDSGEGALELPVVAIAETSLRFSKLLITLRNASGEVDHAALESLIRVQPTSETRTSAPIPASLVHGLSRNAISEVLAYADLADDESIALSDQVAILSGTATVFSALGMSRKKALTMRDLIMRLTGALSQARKRSAAEMGIHPAATLIANGGSNSLLSSEEESQGLSQMMSDVAEIYGVTLKETVDAESNVEASPDFGNRALKLDIVKTLAAFCEASPDLHGIVQVNAAMLRSFGPNAAVDAEPLEAIQVLSKEEQTRCITALNRTVVLAKQLGVPNVEGEYWDDFLIREVEFVPAQPTQALVDISQLKAGSTVEQAPGNPLLYDPNAGRPKTGDEVQHTSMLILNEACMCRVTFQNPYEVSVDVESFELVTEGVVLRTTHQPFTLAPNGIQRMSLAVQPTSTGDCKVTGCVVKIEGCRQRTLPIVSKPWIAQPPAVIKDRDQTIALRHQPTYSTVSLHVIEAQPSLQFEDGSLIESTVMLLDGEAFEMSLTIRNSSDIAACIFDIVTTSDAIQVQDDSAESETDTITVENDDLEGLTIIQPGKTVTFTFDVTGKPSVSQVRISFHYSSYPNATHARILAIPITLTVNAALQVQRLDALPLDLAENGEYSFILTLDIANAWPRSIFYSCFCADLGLKSAEPRRCHNHEGVLAPGQTQRVFMPVARPAHLKDSDDDLEMIRRALLARLRIFWSVEGEEQEEQKHLGEVDVSNLYVSPEALQVIVGEAVTVSLELVEAEHEESDAAKGVVKAGTFAVLRARLMNRAKRTPPLVVFLQSRGMNVPDYGRDDKQLAIAGSHRRVIPSLEQDAFETVDFAFCPLLAGVVELEAVVRAALPKGLKGSQWTSHRKFWLTVV